MVELELVGIHDDGEHLIVQDATNRRYRLAITEELRAAVRRDRPQLEQLRSSSLRPREIQALIRAGATAEEVAEQAHVSLDAIRRYEGPVLAEREYAAQRAQALEVSRSEGAPTLGDLVVDRLAARNISEVTWDAYRPDSGRWHVTAHYTAGTQEYVASWEVDLSSGTFIALDDEARWLSEIDLADSPYRHLTPVEDRFYDVETDGGVQDSATSSDSDSDAGLDETDAILQELQATRGVRQPLEPVEEEVEQTLWQDPPPPAHPPLSRPQDATDATILELPDSHQPKPSDESVPAEPQTAEDKPDSGDKRRRQRNRRGRTSVPSWDEIVFGAKND